MTGPRSGRPEAAKAIWNWREPRAVAGPPPAGRARLRGLIQGGVGLVLGGLIYRFANPIVGSVVLGIGGVIVLAALASPRGLFAAIERAFAALGMLTGKALTWGLMPLVFYLFFYPFSLLFRRGRRDSMRRYFEAESATYWTVRNAERMTPASHQRQY